MVDMFSHHWIRQDGLCRYLVSFSGVFPHDGKVGILSPYASVALISSLAIYTISSIMVLVYVDLPPLNTWRLH